jgi:hypothetical protein
MRPGKYTAMEKIEIDLLKEHLLYELDMLDEATTYLQSSEFSELARLRQRGPEWFKRNAAIEAFWTHARNIVEFLMRVKSADLTVSSASARDFATDFRPSVKLDPIRVKINEQVSHLGFCRTTVQSEKLGHEMTWVKPAIDSEIRRFAKLLNPQCRKHWVSRDPVAFVLLNANTNSTSAMTSFGIDAE